MEITRKRKLEAVLINRNQWIKVYENVFVAKIDNMFHVTDNRKEVGCVQGFKSFTALVNWLDENVPPLTEFTHV